MPNRVNFHCSKHVSQNSPPLFCSYRGRGSQLRRYRRGDKESFIGHLSGLGESSVSLGAAFPATYYRPVRVCHNCYRVYSMVDEARTKSVKRLDAEAAAAAARGFSRDGTGEQRQQKRRVPKRGRGVEAAVDGVSTGRTNEATNQSTQRVKFDALSSATTRGGGSGWGDAGAGGEGSDAVSGESLALMRAQAAIDGLTRGDICELRSFAKPPPAVNMVVAALMIALTGEGEPTPAGWLNAKRFMTNVDKLFAAVAGLDLDNLRVSQTRKLEAYVRNPAFRPDTVACVSLPASKLCAWVLGVLVSGLASFQKVDASC